MTDRHIAGATATTAVALHPAPRLPLFSFAYHGPAYPTPG
jgi:hypothetical protein